MSRAAWSIEMNQLSSLLLLLSLAACAAPAAVQQHAEAGVTVSGALPRTGTLSVADLTALGAEDVRWTFRDQEHSYRGVGLDKVLAHCGFAEGPGGSGIAPAERRPGWRNVIVARAVDGFTAVFTCAEVMPEMGATRVMVVWARDGEPLPGDEGPLRL